MIHIQFQLTVLTTAIALQCYWHQTPDAAPLDWNQSVLPYSLPDIPASFYNDTLPPPRIPMTNGFCGEYQYDSGVELFASNYRRGWSKAVKNFIERQPVGNQEIILVLNLIDRMPCYGESDGNNSLPETRWSEEHISFAFRNGYDEATEQLHELATEIDEIDLRRMLIEPTPRYYYYNWSLLDCVLEMLVDGKDNE